MYHVTTIIIISRFLINSGTTDSTRSKISKCFHVPIVLEILVKLSDLEKSEHGNVAHAPGANYIHPGVKLFLRQVVIGVVSSGLVIAVRGLRGRCSLTTQLFVGVYFSLS